MKTINVLCALFVVLISSYGFSFSSGNLSDADPITEQHITLNLEEGPHLSYESNLYVQVYLTKVQFSIFNNSDFNFLSSHNERIAREYFNFSSLIDPNFGTAEIIFPFHSFL